MKNFQNTYWGKKDNYTFNVLHIEECKQVDDNYIIKVKQYTGYVHNCGPTTPHIVQQTNTYEDVTHEML